MNPSKRKNEEEEKKEKRELSQLLKPSRTKGEIRRESLRKYIDKFNLKVFHTDNCLDIIGSIIIIAVISVILFFVSLVITLAYNTLFGLNIIDGQVRCSLRSVLLLEGFLGFISYILYRYFYSKEKNGNGR